MLRVHCRRIYAHMREAVSDGSHECYIMCMAYGHGILKVQRLLHVETRPSGGLGSSFE